MNPCGEKHFVKGLFYIRNYILTPQTKASFFWTDSQWHWPVSMGTLARELPSGWGARPSPSPHPLDSRCAAQHAALELRPGAASLLPSPTAWRVIRSALLRACCFLHWVRTYPSGTHRAGVVRAGEDVLHARGCWADASSSALDLWTV